VKEVAMKKELKELRDELDVAIGVVAEMLARAGSIDDRVWLLDILRVMDRVATEIDTQSLLERNEAIAELRKSLGGAKSDLEEAHSRAKLLASRLQLAAKAVEALGNLAKQVAAKK
jgi:hypothetical protein